MHDHKCICSCFNGSITYGSPYIAVAGCYGTMVGVFSLVKVPFGDISTSSYSSPNFGAKFLICFEGLCGKEQFFAISSTKYL